MRERLLAGMILVGLAACSRAEAPADTVAAAPAPAPATTAATPAVEDEEELPLVHDDDPHADEPDPTPPEFDPAPWSAAKIPAAAVYGPYLAQWHKADNRATCAPVAPVDLGEHGGAKPRAANFSGGWAVAYDEPGLRSAFGVAGAGVEATGAGDSIWPDSITWADGSIASYGLEGGTGPGHLAYLEIAGQGCLYNVWSKHGPEHLVGLLESLRFVETAAAR